MLSKAAMSFHRSAKVNKTLGSLLVKQARAFSHGPYNPLHYKAHLVPEQLPT